MYSCYKTLHTFSSLSLLRSSSHSASNAPSAGPLKASKKLSTRKSEENLLDDSSSNGSVLRTTTSAEDIHTLATGRSKGGAGSSRPQIIDAVVKLHAPDHTTKYIDISPVSHVTENTYACVRSHLKGFLVNVYFVVLSCDCHVLIT